MKPWLLLLVPFVILRAWAVDPGLNVNFNTLEFMMPGQPVPQVSPFDVDGHSSSLPQEGRYALWMFSGEHLGSSHEEFVLSQIRLVNDYTPPGAGYVVVYPSLTWTMPADFERLAQQLRPHTVLFDEDGELRDLAVSESQGLDGSSLTSIVSFGGLYLVEDGTIRYRFEHPQGWEPSGVAGLVDESVQTFLEGGEPSVVPLPFRVVGTTIPEDFPVKGRPLLLLRVSGLEAEVPEGSLEMRTETGPGGSYRTSFDLDDPALPQKMGRFVLDSLTPILDEHGVQGVGLVIHEPEHIAELAQAFPTWTFIPFSDKESLLRWWEMGSALVVDRSGRVHMSLSLGPGQSGGGFGGSELLEDVLEEVNEVK